jgi:hypothetical protein
VVAVLVAVVLRTLILQQNLAAIAVTLLQYKILTPNVEIVMLILICDYGNAGKNQRY